MTLSKRKKMDGDDELSVVTRAPGAPKKGGFKKFIWNSESKAVFGRTGLSWLKIAIFYILFYLALGAFFLFMLWIFFQTLEPHQPRWIGGKGGLIGTNPGMGFRPMPNVGSTLIWYRRSNNKTRSFWSKQLDDFIHDETRVHHGHGNITECSEGGMSAGKGVACKMDVSRFGPCNRDNHFGYETGQPCILIKLNKIFDWVPEPFDPVKDAKKIINIPMEVKDYIKRTNSTKFVWITCTGKNPTDKENIGPLVYHPLPGIPVHFFPFKKQPGYQTPFIFVQLKSPHPGVLIQIECRAWAKNIFPNTHYRLGSVHFEVMID